MNIKLQNNLTIFRKEFLGANSWEQRKDGVPIHLLDHLSANELKTAEQELIKAVNLGDTWPILGLAHIKSKNALAKLYELLENSNKGFKITIAYAIFQISRDANMIDCVLQELPQTTDQYELIDLLYLLPEFADERITQLLNSFRDHKDYLIAYNATRALGLSTDEVVRKSQQPKS